MLKRLGIFCFYDKDGIVDRYVEYVLADLTKCLDMLIITVNGHINNDSLKLLKGYTEHIIIRENKGFDVGAYRDAIVHFLGEEGIKEWDEIVLCNDTFYGPFIPFKNVFQKMETKEVDFWGLDYRQGKFLSFIQSYFLVFKKRILLNGDLFTYLKSNIDSNSVEISDVYAFFEVGLFSYLVKKGYKYGSFVYTKNYNVYLNGDRCIEELQLPILKKRCFSSQYYSREPMLRVLYYIKQKFNYDIRLILENIDRLYGTAIRLEDVLNYGYLACKSIEKRIPDLAVSEQELLDFIYRYSEIYIYGTGIVARKIWYLYHNSIACFKGFIISDSQKLGKRNLYNYPIMHYKDTKSGSVIILGTDFENSEEIIPTLREEDKILVLWEGLEK